MLFHCQNFDGVGGMSGGTNNRNEPALGRIVASAELGRILS